MRYEIKYVYPNNYEDFLVRDVLNLPGMFREIYHERQVNNIYFDTIALDDYQASVGGASIRAKTRVRWYGDISEISEPALESKRKYGMVGDKKVVNLKEFSLVGRNKLPEEAEMILSDRIPSLINSYSRRYFSTPDDICRITIDWNIRYYAPGQHLGAFGINDSKTILEIKFEKENLSLVTEILQSLNRHIGKNSKYVSGIDAVIYGRATV